MAPTTPGKPTILIKLACFCNMFWQSVGKSINCNIVVANEMSDLGNFISSPLIKKKSSRFCKHIA